MSPSSPSSSELRTVGRLIAGAVGFCLPLVVVAALFEGMFWRSGETVPVRRIAERTIHDDGFLFLRHYFSEQMVLYKHEMLRRKRPEILVLGSSRTFQLRPFMFHPMEDRFYSGSGMIEDIGALGSVAGWMEQGEIFRPRLLVIGLDPWWIRRDGPPAPFGGRGVSRRKDVVRDPTAHLMAARNMILDRSASLRYLSPFATIPAITDGLRPVGLGALQFGTGFRSDGSIHHGYAYREEFLRDPRYRDRGAYISRVRNGTDQFNLRPGIDPVLVRQLFATLQRFRDLGIEVVIFLPPFSRECLMAFRSDPRYVGWWEGYLDVARSLGVECVDATDPSRFGMDDLYMYDGVHPGDVLVARIVEELAAQAPVGSVMGSVDRAFIRAKREQPGVLPVGFPPGN